MKRPGHYALSPGRRILLRDLGIPAGQAGVPEDLLVRESARVTAEEYHALWRSLESHVPRAAIPVAIAGSITAEALDPTLVAALCSADIASAAERIAVFKPLIAPTTLEVMRGGRLTIALRWPADAEPPTSLALTELLF